MRIGLFSDLHVNGWPEFAQTDEQGRNTRLMDCIGVFDKVRDVVRERKIQTVIFLGDLFHKRGILQTLAFNLGASGINKVAAAAGRVILIPGNHDQADRSGTVHALDALQYIAGVEVVHEPGIYDDFLCVPFQPDPENLREAFKKYKGWEYAFVHAGVEGASVGSYEARPPEEFKVKDFGKLAGQFIFSGHYHKHQVLANGKFIYVGAPLQHIRSDAGEERGMIVLDTATGIWERVIFDAPRFVTLDEAAMQKPMAEWDAPGNFVDIKLTSMPTIGLERFRQLADKLGARGVNIIYTPPEEKKEKRLDVDPSMSLPVMLEKYVEEFSSDGLNVKKLLKLGGEFL